MCTIQKISLFFVFVVNGITFYVLKRSVLDNRPCIVNKVSKNVITRFLFKVFKLNLTHEISHYMSFFCLIHASF